MPSALTNKCINKEHCQTHTEKAVCLLSGLLMGSTEHDWLKPNVLVVTWANRARTHFVRQKTVICLYARLHLSIRQVLHRTYLQTVMRLFCSTATFRAEPFFETSPMAIAVCARPHTIQEEGAPRESKDPSQSDTSRLHPLWGDASGERVQPGGLKSRKHF